MELDILEIIEKIDIMYGYLIQNNELPLDMKLNDDTVLGFMKSNIDKIENLGKFGDYKAQFIFNHFCHSDMTFDERIDYAFNLYNDEKVNIGSQFEDGVFVNAFLLNYFDIINYLARKGNKKAMVLVSVNSLEKKKYFKGGEVHENKVRVNKKGW